METRRINKNCSSYPCHDINKLEDCTFCYCPLYPCEVKERGKYLENGYWDCSKCTWIHEKIVVDNIFQLIKNKIR
jgi:Zn-finger protein